MSNTWIKNKAVAWILLIVFTLTSVFTPSMAFAVTEDPQTENSKTKVAIDFHGGTGFLTSFAEDGVTPEPMDVGRYWENYYGSAESFSDLFADIDAEYWVERGFAGWSVSEWEPAIDCDCGAEDHSNCGWWDDETIAEIEGEDPSVMMGYAFEGRSLRFKARWTGDDSDYMSEVFFKTNRGQVLAVSESGQSGGDSFGTNLKEAEEGAMDPIGIQLEPEYGEDYRIIVMQESEDGEMEEVTPGWHKFIWNEENEKYIYESEELVEPYSTESILAMNVPTENIIFVPAWDDMSLEDFLNFVNDNYGDDGDGEESGPFVYIDPNMGNGTIYYKDQDRSNYVECNNWWRESYGEAEKLSDLVREIEIAYWTDRELEGWKVYRNEWYEEDGDGWWDWNLVSDELLETSEIMEYAFEGENLRFTAQWSGDDADYTSEVFFRTNRGEVLAVSEWSQSGGDSFGTRLKEAEEGATEHIGKQLEPEYGEDCQIIIKNEDGEEVTPGWYKFIWNDENGNYVYEADALLDPYSTEEILAMEVPTENIVFVPAWDDMDLDSWLNFLSDNGGGDDEEEYYGPQIEIDFNNGTGYITAFNGDEEDWGSYWEGRPLNGETSLRDFFESLRVEYWTDREFVGWNVYEWQPYENCECGREEHPYCGWFTDEPIDFIEGDSSNIMDYTFEDDMVRFVAQWEGNDDDYLTHVVFATIIGDVYVSGEWNNSTYTQFGNVYRQTDDKIIDQLKDWYGDEFKLSAISWDDENDQEVEAEKWYKFTRNTETGLYEAEAADGDGNIPSYKTDEILNLKTPEDDTAFCAVWEGISVEEYLAWMNEEGNGEGDDGGYEIPENVVQLDVHYYDRDGDFMYTPISIELEQDNEKSFRQLIEEAVEQLEHYPGLGDVVWEIGGDMNENDVAYGGQLINVFPIYEKALVRTQIRYINTAGETDTIYGIKIVDKTATYKEIKDSLLLDAEGLEHRENVLDNVWTFSVSDDEVVMPDPYDYNYDHYITLSANYASYDVHVKLFYQDENGDVKVVDKIVEDVEADTPIKDLYDQQLNLALGTEGNSYAWANHAWYSVDSGVVDLSTENLCAAVQYDDATPVFVTRYLVEGDEDAYHTSMKEDEVYYINDKADIRETENGFKVNQDFTDAVLQSVADAHDEFAKDFEFKGYGLSYRPNVYLAEGFEPGLFYSLEAQYNKALLALTWYDDEGKQTQNIVVDVDETGWAEYTLPQFGNLVQFWDLGGPTYGGRYEMSGSTVEVLTPYTSAVSQYRLSIDGLTEVPAGFTSIEQVKDVLRAEANNDSYFDDEKLALEYFDVNLIWGENNVSVSEGDFPAEGVEFYIPCPEKMDEGSEKIRVTHLITAEGENQGATEKLEFTIEKREDGNYIRVKAYSLSPIAVAYEKHIHSYDLKKVDSKYLKAKATCTSAAVYYLSCTCGEKGTKTFAYGSATGHKWNSGKTTKAATCTAAGVKTYTCTVSGCGATKTASIAKLGHKYSSSYTVDKKATTSATGSKSKHCTRSGCSVKKSVTTIPKISSIKLSTVNYTYTGSAKKPSVTVKNSKGTTLKNGTDYTVTYASGRKKIGKYKVTVKFKGAYSGSKALYFEVGPKNPSSVKTTLYGSNDVKVSWSKVSGASGYKVYYKKSSASSWKLLKTTTSTAYKKANLSDGVKYDFKVVTYKKVSGNACENAGKTSSIYTLKKVAGVKAAKSGTKVKVSWTNIPGESGYQISQSTSKTGTKVVATYATTSGKYKAVSATKGKTYYYRVRAYKTVGKTKIYGPWSSPVKYKR